jgi:cob(I)alamin adenosyltransferase
MTETPPTSQVSPADSDAPEDEEQRHRRKMAKKKAARDRMMSAKTEEKGLILVHTGAGKGKSTAAFGMALRCVGHGYKIGVVQFIKGAMETAERDVLSRFDSVTFKAMGEGFTWETQDKARDIAAAERAWDEVRLMLADPDTRMIVLDEINVVLRYGYLDTAMVLAEIAARPTDQHVVMTGRNAPPEVLDAADLVTEMTLVKHPFRSGVKAQPGIEF